MLPFFRKIRKKMADDNRPLKYMRYAIGEIVLVVIGILIALQINTWNEERKDNLQETTILRSLQNDIQSDLRDLDYSIEFKKTAIIEYTNCLAILSGKKEGTKEEFSKNFRSFLQVGGVTLNATTFNNLQNNGELKLIKNKSLRDSIVGYYNTDYEGWETALRDYTRNNFAPYLLEFDYIPTIEMTQIDPQLQPFVENFTEDLEDYNKEEQSLEAYKNNYMIINMLRFKIRNILGVTAAYTRQNEYANNLNKSIDNYIASK
jgi:hypothetical protein